MNKTWYKDTILGILVLPGAVTGSSPIEVIFEFLNLYLYSRYSFHFYAK
jgi:hypothetical protein